MTPQIDTERLALVPLRPEDATEMAGVLADASLYTFIDGAPPSVHELDALYRRWVVGSPRSDETWHNWIVRLADDGTAVGHVQATVFDDGRADISWVIGTAWQGRGYATETARALVAWLGSAGVTTVSANIHPDNVASSRVAERAGLAPTEDVVDGEVVWGCVQ